MDHGCTDPESPGIVYFIPYSVCRSEQADVAARQQCPARYAVKSADMILRCPCVTLTTSLAIVHLIDVIRRCIFGFEHNAMALALSFLMPERGPEPSKALGNPCMGGDLVWCRVGRGVGLKQTLFMLVRAAWMGPR
jgi:hypothetical protein